METELCWRKHLGCCFQQRGCFVLSQYSGDGARWHRLRKEYKVASFFLHELWCEAKAQTYETSDEVHGIST